MGAASRIEQPELGRYRRSGFVKIVAAVAIAMIAATAYLQWRLRAEAIDRQLETAAMLARNFEDHLSLSFRALDITLSHVAVEDGVGGHFADDIAAPYLRSLSFLDAERQRVTASSNPRNVGAKVALDDFLPAAAEPLELLRVGRPWVGRDFHESRAVDPDRPPPGHAAFFAVSREVAHRDDAWISLVAAVNPDYFINHYLQSVPPEEGAVELLRYDGMLLLSTDARQPVGVVGGRERIVGHIEQNESGRFEHPSPDGNTALVAYRAAKQYPFIVVVRLDKSGALAEWRAETRRTAGIVALALLAGVAMAAWYYRRMERIAREREADEAELKLRGAALGAAANAIIIADREGLVKWANPAFCRLSGYALDETLGRNMRDLVKSGRQPREYYAEVWNTILAGEVWHGELVNRRKDGSLFHEDETITPVRDATGAIREFIAVKQDITERKNSEARMEELSRHLVEVQEGARRRLSGELHDRTSPNLAAIRINLDILAAALPVERAMDLGARLEDTRALIEDTAASIREICNDLRPAVLDYAGLPAALDTYTHQFSRRTGVAVRFDRQGGEGRLPPDAETVLFRVAQEALTNCAKHARASEVVLDLVQAEGKAVLDIRDNGVGFDPERRRGGARGDGLGIVIMRELIEFAGGRFAIDSRPGRGTHVHAELDIGDKTP